MHEHNSSLAGKQFSKGIERGRNVWVVANRKKGMNCTMRAWRRCWNGKNCWVFELKVVGMASPVVQWNTRNRIKVSCLSRKMFTLSHLCCVCHCTGRSRLIWVDDEPVPYRIIDSLAWKVDKSSNTLPHICSLGKALLLHLAEGQSAAAMPHVVSGSSVVHE